MENAVLLISGRLRSTHTARQDATKYRLQYRLSYDGRHRFSEEEKEEVARRLKTKTGEEKVRGQRENEVVVSVGERRNMKSRNIAVMYCYL